MLAGLPGRFLGLVLHLLRLASGQFRSFLHLALDLLRLAPSLLGGLLCLQPCLLRLASGAFRHHLVTGPLGSRARAEAAHH